MPSNYTPNYQLNQWEADDRVLRADFNADNAKIDAVLGTLAEFAAKDRTISSSYEGDNSVEPRTIPLPWEPKLMILMGRINGDGAIGFLTHDACLYCSGLKYYFAGDPYSPKIQGSSLVLNYWFNQGSSYYIAFR